MHPEITWKPVCQLEKTLCSFVLFLPLAVVESLWPQIHQSLHRSPKVPSFETLSLSFSYLLCLIWSVNPSLHHCIDGWPSLQCLPALQLRSTAHSLVLFIPNKLSDDAAENFDCLQVRITSGVKKKEKRDYQLIRLKSSVTSSVLKYETYYMQSGVTTSTKYWRTTHTINYRKVPEGRRHCGFSGDHGYDNKINSMQVLMIIYINKSYQCSNIAYTLISAISTLTERAQRTAS